MYCLTRVLSDTSFPKDVRNIARVLLKDDGCDASFGTIGEWYCYTVIFPIVRFCIVILLLDVGTAVVVILF